MIYFDTDVLINLLIEQDPTKHQFAKELYQTAADQKRFFISQLCILETAFILRKLGESPPDIEATIDAFMAYEPVSSTLEEMKRGITLTGSAGVFSSWYIPLTPISGRAVNSLSKRSIKAKFSADSPAG